MEQAKRNRKTNKRIIRDLVARELTEQYRDLSLDLGSLRRDNKKDRIF